MPATTSAATRRLVLLLVGATALVSLAFVGAAQLLSREAEPERPASAPNVPAELHDAAPVAQSTRPERAVSTPIATSAAPTPPLPDEGSLMAELRAQKERDPKRALELAREGNRRFPNSPDAAERASIAIHALGALGFSAEARGEAEDMVNRYPDGQWVREVEQFTGAHRHRNVRLNAGKLEFYDPPPATTR